MKTDVLQYLGMGPLRLDLHEGPILPVIQDLCFFLLLLFFFFFFYWSMASGPITSWQIDGETMKTATEFILGAPKSLQMVTAAMKLKDAYYLDY